jgi:hypothetical protein
MAAQVLQFPSGAPNAPARPCGRLTPGTPVRVRTHPNGPVMLVVTSGPQETEAVVVRDWGGPGQVVVVTVPTAAIERLPAGDA